MEPVALVLVGSRSLNKRTSRFMESLRSSGLDPVVLAVPRRRWDTSAIEDPTLARSRGFTTLRTAVRRPRRPQRPAVVVCMHWSVLPVALVLKAIMRTRLVYDEHDHYELLAFEGAGPAWVKRARASWVRRIHAWCLPHADVVTCIHLAHDLLEVHLAARAATVVTLHNYPSRRWGDRGRRLASDRRLAIVYVGGIWEVKGCRAMLEAFALLHGDDSIPPIELHAFGTGDADLERDLAAAPGVTFHGSSSYDDIHGFLTSHDCLGLVLLEATPRYALVSTNCHKLYEYLASGAPVLATAVGDLPQIVADLDGGWIIDADFDAQALAGTIREIASRPEEIRRRGDSGATAVEREALWWEVEWQKVVTTGVLDVGRSQPTL